MKQTEQNMPASIHTALNSPVSDSLRFELMGRIREYYNTRNHDSALYYAFTALNLARKNNKLLSEAHILTVTAYYLMQVGRYAESLAYYQQAIALAEDPRTEGSSFTFPSDSNLRQQRLYVAMDAHRNFGHLFGQTGNFERQEYQYRKVIALSIEAKNTHLEAMAYMNLGRFYTTNRKIPDSGLHYAAKARPLLLEEKNYWLAATYRSAGLAYREKGKKDSALANFHEGLHAARQLDHYAMESSILSDLARFYIEERQKDSSLYYARLASSRLDQQGSEKNAFVAEYYEHLAGAFELNEQPVSALAYLKIAKRAKDSYNENYIKNLAAFQNKLYEDQLRMKQKENEQAAYRARASSYLLSGGIALFALLSFVFYRNARLRQKAKDKVEKAYSDLQSTQQQLVQREKMASLGELTAGIAHEIQNPLNFVNNFTEVNRELIEELREEISKGSLPEISAIVNDIDSNEEKILQHGKRADAIVKSMLEHSRAGSGKKEPTDLNALCDEYLRLAYHGMRAKDKNFNVELLTSFDPTIGKVNITSQDIGRVIVNLVNNAFYAVAEKQKTSGEGYQPTVELNTHKTGQKIEIRVKDNGTGIPEKLREKIFQPFFTTKPTGKGTGLGLSLSYDIVKAHGGEIRVESEVGLGTIVSIYLPSAT